MYAEAHGASEVIGIDNDLSLGAQEVILPYLNSQVKLFRLNIYDLVPETFGAFDGVICAGVLYHLRFPFWGLKRIRDVLRPGAWLMLETAVYREHEDLSFLYCPIDAESPYEPTSVTFFNVKGLTDTLSSLGMVVQRVEILGADHPIDRAAFTCQFLPETIPLTLKQYWEKSTIFTPLFPLRNRISCCGMNRHASTNPTVINRARAIQIELPAPAARATPTLRIGGHQQKQPPAAPDALDKAAVKLQNANSNSGS